MMADYINGKAYLKIENIIRVRGNGINRKARTTPTE
jgi:hypothetical protein